MNNNIVLLQKLKKIYQNYGDKTSFENVQNYILKETVLRVRNIEYRRVKKTGLDMELPVGKALDEEIVFFNPTKELVNKLPLNDVKKDAQYITNCLINLLETA